jgi:hypothetical protein
MAFLIFAARAAFFRNTSGATDDGPAVQRTGTLVWNPLMSQDMRGKTARILPFLDALFCVFLGAYVFLGVTRVPFHGDESTLIRMSVDYVNIFQGLDLQSIIYNPDPGFRPVEQSLRIQTGTIDPLVIALAWSAAGIPRGDINGFWVWYPSGAANEWSFNVEAGNMPGTRLLTIARIPSALFLALSIFVVFAVAFRLSRSRPAAWIAAFLYASTPSILVNGRRAMMEGGMLLFTSLVVLCALHILQAMREENPRWRGIHLGWIGLGLAGGLAFACKHTSLLVIAPVYIGIFILIWFTGREMESRRKAALHFRLISGLIGSGVLILSVFYIFTPVWWFYKFHWLILLCLSVLAFLAGNPNPGRWIRLFGMIPVVLLLVITLAFPQAWSGVFQPLQISVEARSIALRDGEEMAGRPLASVKTRIRVMAEQLLLAKAQYSEAYSWDGLAEKEAQIRIYEDARLNGRGGGPAWGVVMFLLLAGGLWGAFLRRREWEMMILFLWLVFPTVIILVTNPLVWQRYYLILIPPWSVLAGFAAVPLTSPEFWKRIRRFFRKPA